MKQILSLAAVVFVLSSHSMAQTGTCTTTQKDILSGENGDIFKTELTNYQANTEELSKVNFKDVSLKVVLGNWCEDSQREVPRLMKILDSKYASSVPVSYYLVNREKYCADPEVQKLDVKFVPAIIVYKNGKEVGRIVETPQATLEKDLAHILAQ